MPDLPLSEFSPPKQSRSRKTLAKIVAAALELIEAHGVAEITIGEIVEKAGSSVGSFYARFAGKDELIHYLREMAWEDALGRWSAARTSPEWSEASLKALVDSVLGFLIRTHREESSVRALLGSGASSPDGHRARFHQMVLADLRPLLLARSAEITHPDPERAVGFAYSLAVATLGAAFSQASWSGGELSDEELAQEVGRAMMNYLGSGFGPSAEVVEETAEFFDIWG